MICIICGRICDSRKDRLKHDLAYHYDYVLAQCGGNHAVLRDFIENN